MKSNGNLRIFDIQRFAVNEGPGIRSAVFFKGCYLNCLWCHNPESICSSIQVMHFDRLCIHCGLCKEKCKTGAINDDYSINLKKCTSCGECVVACSYSAKKRCGTDMHVSQVMDMVMKDCSYYKESGGGVTISGGEPLFQFNGALKLLRALKEAGISTALDTSGFVDEDKFTQICRYVDLFLFDLKHMNNDKHKELTGVGNEVIHKNFRKAVKLGKEIKVRYPMIKNLNDDDENIMLMCNFLRNNGIRKIDVIPYHDIGVSKYSALGLQAHGIQTYSSAELDGKVKQIENLGINANII
jgi:pyruvate formate lyase activating enzyme